MDGLESTLELRKCNICGIEKPLVGNFHLTGRKDSYRYYEKRCLACWAAIRRKWRAENRQEFRAKVAAYRKTYRDKANAHTRAWRLRNLERELKKATQRRRRDRDKLRPYMREKARIWRENNREQSRLNAKRQRAIRKKAKVETVTKEQIRNLFAKQRGRCAICQCKITMDNKHIDHIQPLSKGGVHAIRNLQLTCRPCNMEKHAEDPIDFMQKLGFLL